MTDCIKMGRESVLVPGNRLNLFTGFYLHDMFMNFDEILVGVGNVLHSERIVPCIPETEPVLRIPHCDWFHCCICISFALQENLQNLQLERAKSDAKIKK